MYAQDASVAKCVLVAAMETGKLRTIKDIPMPGVSMSELNEDQIVDQATLVAEVWSGNPEAERVFKDLGWTTAAELHRMWFEDRACEQWTSGGVAQKGVFAVFDGAVG